MKLYHLSDKKLKVISPKYFGKNSFTRNDKNISGVKRAFYYDKPKAQEFLLNDAQYLHSVELSRAKIYDISKDSKKILEKSDGDIDKALRIIKKNYIGATYDCGFQCYIIFNQLTVKESKCIKS